MTTRTIASTRMSFDVRTAIFLVVVLSSSRNNGVADAFGVVPGVAESVGCGSLLDLSLLRTTVETLANHATHIVHDHHHHVTSSSTAAAAAHQHVVAHHHHHVNHHIQHHHHKVVAAAATHGATMTTKTITNAPKSLLDAYKQTLSMHPLVTKMCTGATLAVCGDAIAQRKQRREQQQQEENNDTMELQQLSYDVPRAGSFAIFDMLYRALQHVSFPILVTHFKGQYLGPVAMVALDEFMKRDEIQHAAAAMEQTLGSQLIIVPFLYYPVFFALTGSLQGLDVDGSLKRAQENFLPLMKRNLLFWIPVQFVQFSFIPTDLQIPFLSCAGLAWTFILSVAAGSAKKYSSQPQQQQQQQQQVIGQVVEDPTEQLVITTTSESAFVEVDVGDVTGSATAVAATAASEELVAAPVAEASFARR